ncbi:hypothetical protein D3C85_1424850 [compost metagenome]
MPEQLGIGRQQIVRQHHQRRGTARKPGQAHGTHALEHHAGARVIEGVGNGTGEYPQRTDDHLVAHA